MGTAHRRSKAAKSSLSNNKYAGTLAKPVERRLTTLDHICDPDKRREEIKRRYIEDEEKLAALADHYGVKHGRYRALLLALARDQVPGFKEEKRPGQENKWNDVTRGCLIVEMERLIEPDKRTKGISWAARQLANREHWKKFIRSNESEDTSPDPAEVLRTEYSRHRETPLSCVVRDAFRWHEHQKTLAEWDAKVMDILRNPNNYFPRLPDFDPTAHADQDAEWREWGTSVARMLPPQEPAE